MGFIGSSSTVGVEPGSSPIWNSTPGPTYVESTSSNYSLDQDTSSATSYSLSGSSAALPTGVTISGSNLAYDGAGTPGITTGIIITATNANGSTDSSSFSITINEDPAATEFPIKDFYRAFLDYWGHPGISTNNTRWWDKPTYPTTAVSTETNVAAAETAINAANPGDTVFIQDGTYNGGITITNSGTAGNPITLAAETKGGAVFSNNQIRVDGDYVSVMGLEEVRFDWNGDDGLIAYNYRTQSALNFATIDGDRVRTCYNTVTGLTENDQYFNIRVVGGPAQDCRVDHNHFLIHQGSDTPSGASEIGQVGQAQFGVQYACLIDNNYIHQHLHDGSTGAKTVTGEGECISLKSDFNMMVHNYFLDCNSHSSVRAGDRNAIYGNYIIATDALQGGGPTVRGENNVVGFNYMVGLNSNDASGESALDLFGGRAGDATRDPADNAEVFFNTAVSQIYKGLAINRTTLDTEPDGMYIQNNAIGVINGSVVWTADNSTNTTWGGNVFGPTAGKADAGITEATPSWTSVNGFSMPTTSGNLDGNATAISAMGPIAKALNTAGALVDITGATVSATGADVGAIQLGSTVDPSPTIEIVNNSGRDA